MVTHSGLLTDMYQLTMLDAYVREGLTQDATFELSVRKLPAGRNFLVAAGLEVALEYLQAMRFSKTEVDWIERQGGFAPQTLQCLRDWQFSGEVHAMREGTVFFAEEPILRVTAPLPQAQLVESRLLNLVHYQTLVASKAARAMLAARGKPLVDFGMRRAHGGEAAVLAARAAYLCGFAGTATAEAGQRFGVPVFGTMAHSYVEAHSSEQQALAAFLHARPSPPRGPTLLIDTYDTEAAAAKVVLLAARNGPAFHIGGVRLDSGDLAAHARAVRRILDDGALGATTIFASGNLDEHRIAGLLAAGAPIDAFGVGTSLTTSNDAPALDAIYKLQAYAGQPRRKRSEGKAHWPGAKQVWREFEPASGAAGRGRMRRDHLGGVEEAPPDGAVPLLEPVMRAGARLAPPHSLEALRDWHQSQMDALPERLRSLEPAREPYPLQVSLELRRLAERADADVQP